MDDILGPRSVPPPRPSATLQQKPPVSYTRVAVTALLWGWGCAAILGLASGMLINILFWQENNNAAFVGGANFGGMLGFLLGSIWGVISTLRLELGMASLVGALLGAADTSVHYWGESMLIASPDFPVYWYSIMGLGAGAAVGVFSVVLRNYHENAQ